MDNERDSQSCDRNPYRSGIGIPSYGGNRNNLRSYTKTNQCLYSSVGSVS